MKLITVISLILTGTTGIAVAQTPPTYPKPQSLPITSTVPLTPAQSAALNSAHDVLMSHIHDAHDPLAAATNTYMAIVQSIIGSSTSGTCVNGMYAVDQISTDMENIVHRTGTLPCTPTPGSPAKLGARQDPAATAAAHPTLKVSKVRFTNDQATTFAKAYVSFMSQLHGTPAQRAAAAKVYLDAITPIIGKNKYGPCRNGHQTVDYASTDYANIVHKTGIKTCAVELTAQQKMAAKRVNEMHAAKLAATGAHDVPGQPITVHSNSLSTSVPLTAAQQDTIRKANATLFTHIKDPPDQRKIAAQTYAALSRSITGPDVTSPCINGSKTIDKVGTDGTDLKHRITTLPCTPQDEAQHDYALATAAKAKAAREAAEAK